MRKLKRDILQNEVDSAIVKMHLAEDEKRNISTFSTSNRKIIKEENMEKENYKSIWCITKLPRGSFHSFNEDLCCFWYEATIVYYKCFILISFSVECFLNGKSKWQHILSRYVIIWFMEKLIFVKLTIVHSSLT